MDAARSVTATFLLDAEAPVLTVPASPQNVDTSTALSFQVTASDARAVLLTASQVPPGGIFVDNGDGSGTFTWTPTREQAGLHTVTFRATDPGGLFDEEAVAINAIAYALEVTRDGTGTGSVTSDPAGISCGPTCTANFDPQSSVTLAATPDAGSTFVGWGGACTGTSSCTVTMTANPVVVTATFFSTGWSGVGSLNQARGYHTATLLQNGKVLVAGGEFTQPNEQRFLSSAELFDPATRSWTPTGSMSQSREWHTATLLSNGKVLVAGGSNCCVRLSSAELYATASGAWSATGAMSVPRSEHTTTLLPNGKVLVAGGFTGTNSTSAAEIYDPATESWTFTGSMTVARSAHTATLLANGKVLVAGGQPCCPLRYLASAELYDPGTGSWTTTGTMSIARGWHTASLAGSASVLVAGGVSDVDGSGVASAETYLVASGAWTTVASMSMGRQRHAAGVLATGIVLVAGGAHGVELDSAEAFDPGTSVWASADAMNETRYGHTLTPLANGALAVGGVQSGSGSSKASAEFYLPP